MEDASWEGDEDTDGISVGEFAAVAGAVQEMWAQDVHNP